MTSTEFWGAASFWDVPAPAAAGDPALRTRLLMRLAAAGPDGESRVAIRAFCSGANRAAMLAELALAVDEGVIELLPGKRRTYRLSAVAVDALAVVNPAAVAAFYDPANWER